MFWLPIRRCEERKEQKWTTIIGIALISSANCVATFSGNLLTYANSYLLVRGHEDVTYSSALVLSAWTLTYSCTLIFSHKVTKWLTKYQSMLLGIVIYEISFLLGYWDVDWCLPVFVLDRGVLTGIATGQMLAAGSMYLIEWTEGKNLGLISAVANSPTKGSILVNHLITMYVNSHNLPPDLSRDSTKYFQQEHILNRVPSLFLVLAGTFATIHACGLLLVREPRPPTTSDLTVTGPDTDTDTDTDTAVVGQRRTNATADENVALLVTETDAESPESRPAGSRGRHRRHHHHHDSRLQSPRRDYLAVTSAVSSDEQSDDSSSQGDDSSLPLLQCGGSNQRDGVFEMKKKEQRETPWDNSGVFRNENSATCDGEDLHYDVFKSTKYQETEIDQHSWADYSDVCDRQQEEDGADEDSEDSVITESSQGQKLSSDGELTWRKALKARNFHVLCFAAGSAELTYIILNTFYKTFAQSIIQDDHFLGNVGACMSGAFFICRIAWGVIMDKTGVKTSLVICFSLLSISSIFWFFTPFVSKWLYLIWSCLLAGFSGGMFSVIYMAVFACFGGTNFPTMYGLVQSSGVLVSLVFPPMTSSLLAYLSWPGVMLSMAAINVLALVAIVLYFPYKL